jgi:hypothetical protein
MKLAWEFPECGSFVVSGSDVVEDNFANEDKPSLNIFLRELIQNSLDARSPNSTGPVKVAIRQVTAEPGLMESIFGDEFMDRLKAAEGKRPEENFGRYLVIEDFGTTGLDGVWDDQNNQEDGQHWNAFWFREGEGSKQGKGANGSAGQGKITFYRMSGVRSLIGYTVRESDGATLLMGRSHFSRDYANRGKRYHRHSFWTTSKNDPRPLQDGGELNTWRDRLGLKRNREPGLSLVIPFSEAIKPETILLPLAGEFYFAIKKKRLAFSLNGAEVTHETIEKFANGIEDKDLLRERSAFTSTMRKFTSEMMAIPDEKIIKVKAGWNNESNLKATSFEKNQLESLESDFAAGNILAVRFPVTVSHKGNGRNASHFDVFLQSEEGMTASEEAFIRRDLVIGLEKHLAKGGYLQRARAITLILDEELSGFLSDAEEPTHLKWNSKRKRLRQRYASSEDLLCDVRNAAQRLLALISGSGQEVDKKALGKYFPRPGESIGKSKKKSKGRKNGGTNPEENPDVPKPVGKPFVIDDIRGGVVVKPNASIDWEKISFPIQCKIAFGYVWGDGSDPFGNYDPLDFDLASEKAFPVVYKGNVGAVVATENEIEFEVTGREFELSVKGFDTNLSLKSKLTYRMED